MVVSEKRIDKKRAVTLNIPPPIADALEAVAGNVGGKQKWMVFSAAVLAFIDMPEEIRQTITMQVAAADVGIGNFDTLVGTAKAGRLRSEAQASTGKPAADAAKKRGG